MVLTVGPRKVKAMAGGQHAAAARTLQASGQWVISLGSGQGYDTLGDRSKTVHAPLVAFTYSV
jgi:hypothetical protein